MKSCRLIVAVILLGCSIPTLAQGNISEAAVLFLTINMDVRGRALGDVGVALPNLAFALDANPALLTETEYVGSGYAWGNWLPSLASDLYLQSFHHTVGTRALGYGLALGIGYKRLDLGRQLRIDEFGNFISTFETHEEAFTMGVAVRLGQYVNVGASVKRINSVLSDLGAGQEQGDGTATGWAFDLGVYLGGVFPQATYTAAWPRSPSAAFWDRWTVNRQSGFSLGLAIRNLGSEISYIDAAQADPLPRVAALGASYRPVNTYAVSLLLVGEMERSLVGSDWGEAEDSWYGWGVELSVLRLVDLRVGRVSDSQGDLFPVTYGLGVGTDRVQFNYSRMEEAEWSPVDNTQIFSVTIRW